LYIQDVLLLKVFINKNPPRLDTGGFTDYTFTCQGVVFTVVIASGRVRAARLLFWLRGNKNNPDTGSGKTR
jgi:hypothetical protein